MWFSHSFDSFLTLGICKEYPIMARTRSGFGTAPARKEEKPAVNPAVALGVKDAAAEPRRKLAAVNFEDEIRRRAYELYEQRGYLPGHETEDWLEAEREVLARYSQSARA